METLRNKSIDPIAWTAHELRTPLHGILGLARRGMEAGTKEEKDACFASVLQAGEQMMQLVNRLLEPSAETGAEDYYLSDLAAGVQSLLRAWAGPERELTVSVSGEASRRLHGEVSAIRQILLNLGGNAVKYAAPSPVHIFLSVDDTATITAMVEDSGPGIPPERMEAVFAPFVRESAGEGTGLGLAVSRSLAESMGGTLTGESRVGQGCIFTLRVPQRWAEEPVTGPWMAPDARVLVADDSPISLLATTGLFQTWKIRPVTARSGQEALQQAEKGFDLILLDAMMPDLSGAEILRCLRERGVAVPIVAVTGLQADHPALAAFDGVLTKPVSREQLERALLRWLPSDRVIPLA